MYNLVEKGLYNSTNYRLYFKNSYGKFISPLHDIPLIPDNINDNIFNMIVKAPRWSNIKIGSPMAILNTDILQKKFVAIYDSYTITQTESLNPIKQCFHNGNIQYLSDMPFYHGYLWNYGVLPQTGTLRKPPIDVFEVGQKVLKHYDVVQVKVLGAIPLIFNNGEWFEWKIFVINVNDPDAEKLIELQQLYEQLTSIFKTTVDWLLKSGIYDENIKIKLGNAGKPKGKASATKVILESHGFWKYFITGRGKSNNSTSLKLTTTITNSPYFVQYKVMEAALK